MDKTQIKQIDREKTIYYQTGSKSIADILLIFVENIKIILIVPSFLCIIMIIYVLFFATPVFTSSSKIMSSSGSGGTSQAIGLAAQFGINIPTNQSEPKWVYPEILRSRTLARSLLKQKFDTMEFGSQKTLLQILTYGNEPPEYGIDTLESIGIKALLEIIDVSEDLKTSVLTLQVNTFEPKLAADINKSLIEGLDAHQRIYNKSKTSKTKYFIKDRILETEKELMAAEEDLKVFRDRNRRIENSPALLLEQQRLGREVTVLTGVFTTLKQQLETTKIEEVKESNYVVIVDHPNIPLERSKPNKSKMVILTGFLGIILGLGLVLIKDLITKTDNEEKKKIFEDKIFGLQKH